MGTNPIKIKDVGRREIWMDECFLGVPTFKYYITWILLCGIPLGIAIWVNIFAVTPTDKSIFIVFTTGCMFMIFAVMNTVIQYGKKWEPGYNVFIKGEKEINTIRRADPETDARNVCRAAQELERTALELTKAEREMEQIALKCK
jgi:hypothetical protein